MLSSTMICTEAAVFEMLFQKLGSIEGRDSILFGHVDQRLATTLLHCRQRRIQNDEASMRSFILSAVAEDGDRKSRVHDSAESFSMRSAQLPVDLYIVAILLEFDADVVLPRPLL